jgi:hypothetical protein
LTTKSNSCSTVDNPLHVEISDHKTA